MWSCRATSEMGANENEKAAATSNGDCPLRLFLISPPVGKIEPCTWDGILQRGTAQPAWEDDGARLS
jgi:hypothetical protein